MNGRPPNFRFSRHLSILVRPILRRWRTDPALPFAQPNYATMGLVLGNPDTGPCDTDGSGG
jgi:hypothetical protein